MSFLARARAAVNTNGRADCLGNRHTPTALAEERSLTLVVDVRRFGQPLFYTALEGTTPDNVDWVRRKSNVVARFHRSSYAVGLTHEIKKTIRSKPDGLAIDDYAAHGGSFPLAVEDAQASSAASTVSGLPQRDDHNSSSKPSVVCSAGITPH